MKHAYMVMAHDNFNVLNKQLKLLDDERNDFFIHVDVKAGDFDKQAILAGVEKSKVTFIPRLDGKYLTKMNSKYKSYPNFHKNLKLPFYF